MYIFINIQVTSDFPAQYNFGTLSKEYFLTPILIGIKNHKLTTFNAKIGLRLSI